MLPTSFSALSNAIEVTGAVSGGDEKLLVTIDQQQKVVPIWPRREQYRAQILPDIHPVSVSAHKIEDIFSRWLQTLADAEGAAIRLDNQSAQQIIKTILDRDKAIVIRKGDPEQVIPILAKWLAESYAVWPGDDARLKGSITAEVPSVQPLHLIVAYLWPTTVPDYGRLLFPLLAVDSRGDSWNYAAIKSLREYLGKTDRLGLFGDLIYQSFRSDISLPQEPKYAKAAEYFASPYCLPHALRLQSDVRLLLGAFEKNLHRTVLIEWLQNLLAVHLALYYLRIAYAVADDTQAFFAALTNLRSQGTFDSNTAPPLRCHAKCNGDIANCKYHAQITIPMWLQEGIPSPNMSSRQQHETHDNALYELALDVILIGRMRDLMNSYYSDGSASLWSLRDCLDMCAADLGFREYLEKAALLQAAHYLDLSDIAEDHKEEKWSLARQHPAGPLYILRKFIRDDYATVPQRTDRALANIAKFYRQLARNQDRGFLALFGSNPRYGTWYYRLHDDLLTLMVHLVAAHLRGKPTIAQLEEQLESIYGLQVSDTRSGTDPNEQALRRRLQGLGMFRTVSDAREAQFIEPVFAV